MVLRPIGRKPTTTTREANNGFRSKRSRNLIFKANQDENKKSVGGSNVYLATNTQKSPIKQCYTSYNSPLCLDQVDRTKTTSDTSSTHLFHYGKRSNDSRGTKHHSKKQHSDKLLQNLKQPFQTRILNVNLGGPNS